MKWYHFTGMKTLGRILQDEAVMSFYEILRRDVKGDPECLARLEEAMRKSEAENIREFQRKAHVWFAPDTERLYGSANDVVLGLELNLPPTEGKLLHVPQVSLDHFVDLGVIENWSVSHVRQLVHTAHNGKYRHVKLYRFKQQ